jgi:hypothetical protein
MGKLDYRERKRGDDEEPTRFRQSQSRNPESRHLTIRQTMVSPQMPEGCTGGMRE